MIIQVIVSRKWLIVFSKMHMIKMIQISFTLKTVYVQHTYIKNMKTILSNQRKCWNVEWWTPRAVLKKAKQYYLGFLSLIILPSICFNCTISTLLTWLCLFFNLRKSCNNHSLGREQFPFFLAVTVTFNVLWASQYRTNDVTVIAIWKL